MTQIIVTSNIGGPMVPGNHYILDSSSNALAMSLPTGPGTAGDKIMCSVYARVNQIQIFGTSILTKQGPVVRVDLQDVTNQSITFERVSTGSIWQVTADCLIPYQHEARGSTSSVQGFPNGSTQINLAAVEYDNGSVYNAIDLANNYIICQRDGLYLCGSSIELDSEDAGQQIQLGIFRINGGGTLPGTARFTSTNQINSGWTNWLSIAMPMQMQKNDKLSASIYRTGSGTKNSNTSNPARLFMIEQR